MKWSKVIVFNVLLFKSFIKILDFVRTLLLACTLSLVVLVLWSWYIEIVFVFIFLCNSLLVLESWELRLRLLWLDSSRRIIRRCSFREGVDRRFKQGLAAALFLLICLFLYFSFQRFCSCILFLRVFKSRLCLSLALRGFLLCFRLLVLLLRCRLLIRLSIIFS